MNHSSSWNCFIFCVYKEKAKQSIKDFFRLKLYNLCSLKLFFCHTVIKQFKNKQQQHKSVFFGIIISILELK